MTETLIPPQNLEAEESVLGAMMLSPGAILAVSETLDASHFYRESHARIYRAAVGLDARNEPVDAITLIDELTERGELEAVGGRARINELARLVPASANARHYAEIVRDTAALRGFIRVGGDIARLGWERPGPLPELQEQAERLVFDLTDTHTAGDLEHVKESLAHTRQLLHDHADKDVTGTPTGLRDLDALTSGLQPGNLVVLAGRPSMGKSALALTICNRVADEGIPAAMFSLEMSKVELSQRLLSLETGIPLQRIRRADLDKFQWETADRGFARLATVPLFLDDSGDLRLADVRSRSRRLRARHHDLGVLVVDYLQLMAGDADNRVQEVTEISRGLKTLARDLNVPVLALSQLSRNLEYRNDKRPILSDLRESGSIEQDADVVIFVYRDSVYNREADQSKAELIVAKHRNGPIAAVNVHWDKTRARFADA